jgi:hypothetical protein
MGFSVFVRYPRGKMRFFVSWSHAQASARERICSTVGWSGSQSRFLHRNGHGFLFFGGIAATNRDFSQKKRETGREK